MDKSTIVTAISCSHSCMPSRGSSANTSKGPTRSTHSEDVLLDTLTMLYSGSNEWHHTLDFNKLPTWLVDEISKSTGSPEGLLGMPRRMEVRRRLSQRASDLGDMVEMQDLGFDRSSFVEQGIHQAHSWLTGKMEEQSEAER